MPNHWTYQYLDDERLHYITEQHPEDGILGETFFQHHEYGELIKFCLDNNLSFEKLGLPHISEVIDQGELFAGLYKINDIDFSCRIKMYDGDDKLYKSQYKITLDMLEDLPAESLGIILKEMLQQLKTHIRNEQK